MQDTGHWPIGAEQSVKYLLPAIMDSQLCHTVSVNGQSAVPYGQCQWTVSCAIRSVLMDSQLCHTVSVNGQSAMPYGQCQWTVSCAIRSVSMDSQLCHTVSANGQSAVPYGHRCCTVGVEDGAMPIQDPGTGWACTGMRMG
jgi:hypothetical protein